MREIKFRAWDKKKKIMCGVVALDLWNSDCDLGTTQIYNLTTDIDLMQCAGLKDKNGKDIYEGDIAIISDTAYVMRYNENYARFVFSRDKNFIAGINIDNIEIIGNLYENPELLDKDGVEE